MAGLFPVNPSSFPVLFIFCIIWYVFSLSFHVFQNKKILNWVQIWIINFCSVQTQHSRWQVVEKDVSQLFIKRTLLLFSFQIKHYGDNLKKLINGCRRWLFPVNSSSIIPPPHLKRSRKHMGGSSPKIWTRMSGAGGKELACQCRRHKRRKSDPRVGKVPWRRKRQPIQYSCLGNPVDRGDWQTIIHGAAKSQTQRKQLSTVQGG